MNAAMFMLTNFKPGGIPGRQFFSTAVEVAWVLSGCPIPMTNESASRSNAFGRRKLPVTTKSRQGFFCGCIGKAVSPFAAGLLFQTPTELPGFCPSVASLARPSWASAVIARLPAPDPRCINGAFCWHENQIQQTARASKVVSFFFFFLSGSGSRGNNTNGGPQRAPTDNRKRPRFLESFACNRGRVTAPVSAET